MRGWTSNGLRPVVAGMAGSFILGRTRILANRSALKLNDIVVSKVENGHHLLIVTAMPSDPMSLVYRGDGWNVQYAVARGARLAEGKGGDLWYTSDGLATLQYLETFRAGRELTSVH
jgi:hypothetical protein